MKNKIPIILLGIFLFLLAGISADTGPHLSVSLYFKITYNNSSITENFSANLLACRENGCEDDNGVLCTEGVCEFHYYRIERVPKQMKILVNINGENFSSDIINFSWRDSVLFYDIDINPNNKVIITPSEPFPTPKISSGLSLGISLILALALTIVFEIIVMIIFLRKWKIKTEKWKRPIITLIIVDIISVPLVWIIFFVLLIILAIELVSSALLAILIAEICAVVFESYFVYWFNKKIINLKRSFILSIVMNLASFIVGGIILTALLIMWQT
jgi:hypothetical protein